MLNYLVTFYKMHILYTNGCAYQTGECTMHKKIKFIASTQLNT